MWFAERELGRPGTKKNWKGGTSAARLLQSIVANGAGIELISSTRGSPSWPRRPMSIPEAGGGNRKPFINPHGFLQTCSRHENNRGGLRNTGLLFV